MNGYRHVRRRREMGVGSVVVPLRVRIGGILGIAALARVICGGCQRRRILDKGGAKVTEAHNACVGHASREKLLSCGKCCEWST